MRRPVLVVALLMLLTLAAPALAAGTAPRILAAGGFHSLWIANDGLMWGTGYNATGALGDGTFKQRKAPVAAGVFDDWTECAAGYYSSYGLRKDGSLWGWGANNKGQLARSKPAKVNRPVPLGAPARFTAVAAGAFHVLALKSDGSLWASGDNSHGQLGIGSKAPSSALLQVSGGPWTAVTACGYTSAARNADGSWWMWGAGDYGQLGGASTADRVIPQFVANPTVGEIYLGGYQSFAQWAPGQAKAGQVTSTGRNRWGTLGRGTYDPTDGPIARFDPIAVTWAFSDVGAGYFHTLAIRTDGQVVAWGRGLKGEIGNGAASEVNATPILIGFGNALAVAAGEEFSLARRDDSTIWGWGTNAQGQLGSAPKVVISPHMIAPLTTAYLSAPSVPAKVIAGKTLKVVGVMLPRHKGTVRVTFSRKTGNGLKAVKTIAAKVKLTTAGARWTATYVPKQAGDWVVKASHTGDVHTRSMSPNTAFKVK